ncbi:MAG TPA: hypothetical protein VKU19_30985 [Bryobacteraceae bacterium]|nr:hypothetical protein [Bryobacteraceae bacterium]
MNPGLVIKLRPVGPWRIGPDSGARNRVDYIYHSDSLYSAVTAAMGRMGSLDAWLDATARRAQAPEVCFSSCFPFLDEIGFVVPPRTVWPPVGRALVSARVRWKSARFVPLGVVQAVLSGQQLDDNHWMVDGASECLVPAGRPGPFRTAVRWSAAVDRLTGAAERHSTACLEFRAGAGMWTIVSFLDQAAHTRWADPVKAAFRLLADSGFGGERSRGWGRAESPEFIDGMLPDMILPPIQAVSPSTEEPEPVPVTEPPQEQPPIEEPPIEEPPAEEPPVEASVKAASNLEALIVEAPGVEEEASTGVSTPQAEIPRHIEEPTVTADREATAVGTEEAAAEPTAAEPTAPEAESAAAEAPSAQAEEVQPPIPNPQPPTPAVEASTPVVEAPAPGPKPVTSEVEAQAPVSAHWLLSLFTPAAADSVDWRKGNYTVLARGGRVDSPAGSGELKKHVQMIAEGSVIFAPSGPSGAAADVAPDGFPHPVFRAGFALAIPLPEVS